METGFAAGYSRKVEKAADAVYAAKKRLLMVLKAEYPMDQQVRVVHYRGEVFGVVVGWDYDGSRVLVRNHKSGKVNKWWSRHVELT